MPKFALYLFPLFLIASCSKAPPQLPLAHKVLTQHPTVADVPRYVDYIGHLTANVSVSVRSQVSGALVGQYFVEGQEVKQGDLLLVIDPRPYEATLEQAKGALQETHASLVYSREKTARYAPLVEQDFVSKLNFDEYITNVLVEEALLVQRKAALDSAQINLGYCFISAPMDCITGHLQVKTGNYVDANANTELMLLNQIKPILVDFYIPETDLFAIQEKQKQGPLKLLVYPEPSHQHVFEGALTLINNQISTATGSLFLEGSLTNEEGMLWPGHFVDVRLILDEIKGALLVPNQAVLPGQGGHYIFVVTPEMKAEVRQVTLGQHYEGDLISITSGLSPSDLIITEGQLNLYPGASVAPSSQTPNESTQP